MRSHQRGFTLIELMTVLVIAALVLAVGIPSFKTFTTTQRIKAAAGEFATAATFARSEAIKRNTKVTITPGGAGWQHGWSIAAGGTVLSDQSAYPGVVMNAVDAEGGPVDVEPVSYLNSGRLEAAVPDVQIEGMADAPDAPKRCISFDLSGMPKTRRGECKS